MSEEVSRPEFNSVRDRCLIKHEQCAFWATAGECENNPSFMLVDCGPLCFSCHKMLDNFDES